MCHVYRSCPLVSLLWSHYGHTVTVSVSVPEKKMISIISSCSSCYSFVVHYLIYKSSCAMQQSSCIQGRGGGHTFFVHHIKCSLLADCPSLTCIITIKYSYSSYHHHYFKDMKFHFSGASGLLSRAYCPQNLSFPYIPNMTCLITVHHVINHCSYDIKRGQIQ